VKRTGVIDLATRWPAKSGNEQVIVLGLQCDARQGLVESFSWTKYADISVILGLTNIEYTYGMREVENTFSLKKH